jgi:hypothetical protein
MAHRPIKKIDLVPTWIREAVADTMQPGEPSQAELPGAPKPMTNGPTKQSFSIVDPYAPGKGEQTIMRSVKAEYNEDPESGTTVVQLGWEGTQPPIPIFYKKFASSNDARMVSSEMLKELGQIASYAETNPDKAKTKAKELFDKYKGQSDPIMSAPGEGTGSRSNSSLHTKIADGWEVINKEGKLSVSFSDDFLANVFSKYKEASATPVSPSEYIYSTATRPHCGTDDFVVSYWRKAKLSDGNIIRNAAMISRAGGETFLVANIPLEDYNTLCSALTPSPAHYGISYDSITGQWVKTAAVVERYFANNADELDKILDYLGKGKKAPEEAKPEKKEKGEKKPSDEEKKLDELLGEPLPGESKTEESLPLAGEGQTAPMGGGSNEQDLADLLKKEAEKK